MFSFHSFSFRWQFYCHYACFFKYLVVLITKCLRSFAIAFLEQLSHVANGFHANSGIVILHPFPILDYVIGTVSLCHQIKQFFPCCDNAFLELFDLFAVRVIDFNWNFDGIAKVILEIRYLRERWRSESIIGCHHCKNLVCTRRERLFTLIMVVFMFLAICRIYCFYDKGIVSLVFMFYDWLSEPRFVTYNDFVFF